MPSRPPWPSASSQALGIKTASVDTPIGLLSGGNQQKAMIARWLATEPRLLILDEPTRGIDVAAKQEIMEEILRLARAGMAVIFISSEMSEVVRVAHRIVVLRDRQQGGRTARWQHGGRGLRNDCGAA
jgi:monosaccharide-transporting ATPase